MSLIIIFDERVLIDFIEILKYIFDLQLDSPCGVRAGRFKFSHSGSGGKGWVKMAHGEVIFWAKIESYWGLAH